MENEKSTGMVKKVVGKLKDLLMRMLGGLKNMICSNNAVALDLTGLNGLIAKDFSEESGSISDGFYAFDDLYRNNRELLQIICVLHSSECYKRKILSHKPKKDRLESKYFMLCIEIQHHEREIPVKIEHWDEFDVEERRAV